MLWCNFLTLKMLRQVCDPFTLVAGVSDDGNEMHLPCYSCFKFLPTFPFFFSSTFKLGCLVIIYGTSQATRNYWTEHKQMSRAYESMVFLRTHHSITCSTWGVCRRACLRTAGHISRSTTATAHLNSSPAGGRCWYITSLNSVPEENAIKVVQITPISKN